MGLNGSKPLTEPNAARDKVISEQAQAVKPVSPEEITPANARQTVNALWQELDHAAE
jgi:hypothetical protein